MVSARLIRAAADAGGGLQIFKDPTTYIGTTGVGAVMLFLYRLVSKIIDRGDKRDDRQWAQMEADLKRKNEENAQLKIERDQYQALWLDAINGRTSR